MRRGLLELVVDVYPARTGMATDAVAGTRWDRDGQGTGVDRAGDPAGCGAEVQFHRAGVGPGVHLGENSTVPVTDPEPAWAVTGPWTAYSLTVPEPVRMSSGPVSPLARTVPESLTTCTGVPSGT